MVSMDNAAAANSHPQEVTDHHDNRQTNTPPVFPRSNLQVKNSVTLINVNVHYAVLSSSQPN